MDFSMDDDQVALQDAVRRFCERTFGVGWSAGTKPVRERLDCWGGMAELGLPGLAIGEDVGGSGQTPVAVALVVDELARYLLADRFIESSVLCGTLLERVMAPARRAELLTPLAAGNLRLALALDDGLLDNGRVTTTAKLVDGRWRVDGAKARVMDGDQADVLLVTAARDRNGAAADGARVLLAIAGDTPGVRCTPAPRLDGETVSRVELHQVSLDASARVDEPGSLEPGLAAAIDAAQAALCAERAGILTSLLEMTMEHLKTRRQFGRPLADFQALQHQLADVYMRVEQCRSMAQLAAMAVPAVAGSAGDRTAAATAAARARAKAIPAAAAYTQEAAQVIGETVIQLHGAMGMTEESPVGHYVRRLLVSGARFGSIAQQLERFGELDRAVAS